MENFDGHVQLMLRSLSGMNYADLEELLNFIIHARCKNYEKEHELMLNQEITDKNDILDQIKETEENAVNLGKTVGSTSAEDFLPGCRLHDVFDVIQASAALKMIPGKKEE